MARSHYFDIDPMNVDDDGLVEDETLSGGGAQNFTLGGALISGGKFTESYSVGGTAAPWGRRLICTATGNESARTFTFTGTDPDGRAITETMAGPNATTDETTAYFKTITSIASDDDTANNVKFGTVDEIRTATVNLNFIAQRTARSVANVTGTANFTIQGTTDDIQKKYNGTTNAQANLFTIDEQAAGTVDVATVLSLGLTGVYLTVNSYTNTAEIEWNITEGYSGL